MHKNRFITAILLALLVTAANGQTPAPAASANKSGIVRGTVVIARDKSVLHRATVLLVQLGRQVETNEQGEYQFNNVPPGRYGVVVRAQGLADQRRVVTVQPGQVVIEDFEMRFASVREEVTVTATGTQVEAFEAFQSVATMDAIELVENAGLSLGEVLNEQPGVTSRSFGPGSSRPVIRGFSGDRVLVMKDGIATGSLSSQSADHGEAIDVLSLTQLEVVKGPATLLYGSSALGGVVNAITPQEHIEDYIHTGLSGYVSGLGGSNGGHAGGGAGFEYGFNKWLLWGNLSGQRMGNYDAPTGEVDNSKSRITNGTAGAGWLGERGFFSLAGGVEDGRYGIPFGGLLEGEPDADIDIAMRRYNWRVTTGMRNLRQWVTGFRVRLDYSDYNHKELETEDGVEEVGTNFDNGQFTYRMVFDQRKQGRWSGSFGFSGMLRNYDVTGTEALAPPVDHHSVALFALQEIDLEKLRLQFGGRVENNQYDAVGTIDRSFTGFSGAMGAHVPLWTNGALVANYTHATRAPALEELYNNGPHLGNLTFEVGNAELDHEVSDGVELSVRHRSDRLRAELSGFYYWIGEYVFLAPTGNIEDGLVEAEYLQADAAYRGFEGSLSVMLQRHAWLNVGLDMVDAMLRAPVTSSTGVTTAEDTPLPRIPPLRGRVGLDLRVGGLSVKPEVLMVKDQDEVFPTETRTAGYALFSVGATYTLPRQHTTHIFTVEAFNLGDRLYRNHLSFIKELAPEMGRGVRFGYTLRFF